MSAEVLREAAARMRLVANDASCVVGAFDRWNVERVNGDEAVVSMVIDDRAGDIIDPTDLTTAEFIAAWSPVVAAAVSDWLEATAVIATWGDHVGPGPVASTVKAATAVANAYLGRS